MESTTNLTRTESQKSGLTTRMRPSVAPAVDIFENDEEVLLIADVPGVEPSEVQIRYERGELTLRAARTQGFSQGDLLAGEGGSEFDYVRSFRVSGAIDPDRIEADLKHGVLRLRLPKRDTVKPRQIPIKAS